MASRSASPKHDDFTNSRPGGLASRSVSPKNDEYTRSRPGGLAPRSVSPKNDEYPKRRPGSLIVDRELLDRSSSPKASSLAARRKGFHVAVSTRSLAATRVLQKPEKMIRRMSDEEKIYDLYEWDEVLQEEGDGGKVVVCRSKVCREPNVDYVMKIRSKKSLREQGWLDTFRKVQLRTLNMPAHSGVIPTYEVLEDDRFYYIVMEKATGGSFFEGLLNEFSTGVIPAAELKRLTREMLDSVAHIHRQGMLHRDIKPDNFVMMVCDDPQSPTGKSMHVMLTDFDHAEPEWSPKTKAKVEGRYGTLIFNAPETFQGYFSEQSDLYSIGACLYLLMTGKMPYADDLYENNDFQDTYDRMRVAQVDWTCDPWPHQERCKELCQRLLAFDPKDRHESAEQARESAWFNEEQQAPAQAETGS
eukprot:TRINITY_DN16737_c0_g1_i1.p1 TRINITY_DN16737_c0_g1~~TRINITY_DN16737_c0_g1_i1.p1  ORF type:complete len:445 (+),score=68.40 TRINITY_DN16737_c0_g1_i1:90-1337(+)